MTRRRSETIEQMREELRTEGARDAINALREVCRDPAASSQAKATAATTILRAGGFLQPDDDPDDERPLSELTAEELNARAERGRALIAQLEQEQEQEREQAERGVFD